MRPALSLVLALPLLSSAAISPAPPTFAHDIAPILYRACANCHHADGDAPFPLVTYADASKRARQIAAVTASHFMPPWLPQHGYANFAGERRLSPAEIRTIARWAAAGAPQGPAAQIPDSPNYPDGWQLGPPDLVLEAAAPFTVPASGSDVYWNFVFRPGLKQRRWVRAVEIRPGARNVLHHANLLVDRLPALHGVATGFPGMDLQLFRSPFDPDGHFLFWKPGGSPHVEPAGQAWRLDTGFELILNAHMRPTGKPELVRPRIGLYFTDQPQTQFPFVFELQKDDALPIPAGDADFRVSDDFTIPLDCDLLAVYPHAHYLGRAIEAWATLPGGRRKSLIRIPDWNPSWQSVYYYQAPVFLPRGAVVSVRWHFDNSSGNPRNPNHPPKLVEAGDQATDEMAHFWLQVLPRGEGDRRREFDQAVLEHRLKSNPADFYANFNLGAVLFSRLNPTAAVSALEAAVKTRPDRNDARDMLGVALAAVGRTGEAIEQFDVVLFTAPNDPRARFNRAEALGKSGHLQQAVEDYRAVIAALPNDPLPKRRLDETLRALSAARRP